MLFVASHAKADIDAFRQEQTANVFPSSSLYAAKKPRYRNQKERKAPEDVECNTIINVTSKRMPYIKREQVLPQVRNP